MNDSANWYPTHSIGPVAQWIDDRFSTLTALSATAARIAGVIPYSQGVD